MSAASGAAPDAGRRHLRLRDREPVPEKDEFGQSHDHFPEGLDTSHPHGGARDSRGTRLTGFSGVGWVAQGHTQRSAVRALSFSRCPHLPPLRPLSRGGEPSRRALPLVRSARSPPGRRPASSPADLCVPGDRCSRRRALARPPRSRLAGSCGCEARSRAHHTMHARLPRRAACAPAAVIAAGWLRPKGACRAPNEN